MKLFEQLPLNLLQIKFSIYIFSKYFDLKHENSLSFLSFFNEKNSILYYKFINLIE